MPLECAMHDETARLAGGLVTVDQDLEREFETRLVESSTLAFRVAYGVLRHRQDAEDVAQEAFVKAYRSFRELRDRERFRAWLVRMTWRLAIDRQRNDRRRLAREDAAAGPDEIVGRQPTRPRHSSRSRNARARRAAVGSNRRAARQAADRHRARQHRGARHRRRGAPARRAGRHREVALVSRAPTVEGAAAMIDEEIREALDVDPVAGVSGAGAHAHRERAGAVRPGDGRGRSPRPERWRRP